MNDFPEHLREFAAEGASLIYEAHRRQELAGKFLRGLASRLAQNPGYRPLMERLYRPVIQVTDEGLFSESKPLSVAEVRRAFDADFLEKRAVDLEAESKTLRGQAQERMEELPDWVLSKGEASDQPFIDPEYLRGVLETLPILHELGNVVARAATSAGDALTVDEAHEQALVRFEEFGASVGAKALEAGVSDSYAQGVGYVRELVQEKLGAMKDKQEEIRSAAAGGRKVNDAARIVEYSERTRFGHATTVAAAGQLVGQMSAVRRSVDVVLDLQQQATERGEAAGFARSFAPVVADELQREWRTAGEEVQGEFTDISQLLSSASGAEFAQITVAATPILPDAGRTKSELAFG